MIRRMFQGAFALALVASSVTAAAQPALPAAQPALPDARPSDPPGDPAGSPASAELSEDREPTRAAPPVAPPSAHGAPPGEGPPGPAVILADDAPAKDEPVPEPRVRRPSYLSLGLGVRAAVVESKGYDPYSGNNALAMVTLFGTVTPWPTRPVSVHLAFEWDYGGSEARARGLPAVLDVHRLALGLEVRYLPVSRISLFARAMPAAIHLGGTVADSSFADHLEANAWTWGVDLTGGAAARVAAFGDMEYPAAAIWIGLDMGYRFAGAAAMRLRPGGLSDEDKGRRFGEVPMQDLDLSGFVGRLTGSVSF